MSAHLSEGPRLKRRRLSESSEAISEASYSSHAGSSDASDSDAGIDSGRTKRSVHPELSDSEDDAPKLQFNFDTAPNRVTKTNRTQLARQHPAPKDVTFGSLGVKPSLVTSLEAMSIRRPTPVQIGCLPSIISGRDCIGNAKTGSGKTMAFAIPILQKLSEDPYGIYALVLTPTRQAALLDLYSRLIKPQGIGVPDIRAVRSLGRVIELEDSGDPTPGRLVDHMDSNGSEWSLSRLKFLVLDEADRLLTDTFAEDLAKILSKTPKDRQTCLFTATWTPAVESLANATPQPGKQTPFVYRMTDSVETVGTLKQHYLLVPSHVREPYLFYALCNPPESIAHMRVAAPEPQEPSHKSKKVNKAFRPPKVDQEAIKQPPHHHLRLETQNSSIPRQVTPNARHTRHRAPFAAKTARTTQLAQPVPLESRPGVDQYGRGRAAPEEYTHRVGRTARAGRNGMAISFVTERDEEKIHKVEARIGTTLTELSLPEEKVLEGLNAVSTAKRIANMELHDSEFGKREEIHAKKAAKLAK
ncbi:DEAD box helicase family [Rhizoctonia solani]|uniref:DEAD box helicase family n=1 Tax=Rhizoctonia solani TaxID=456999 RepID=A0A8H7IMN4_9AGAM|nr:DEAD box helicase family [Rhizoctonia solani]